MSRHVEHWLKERASAPLPENVRTKNKAKFNPSANVWSYRDGTRNVSIDFTTLPALTPELLHGLKMALVWVAENKSPGTLCAYFNSFKRVAEFLANRSSRLIQCIRYDDLLAFKDSSLDAEYQLASVRGFFIQWAKLGAPGINGDISNKLSKLTCKQHPVGVAVATLDPSKGPLIDFEFEALQSELNLAYERRVVNESRLLEAYLFLALGIRPDQLAQLKCCDLLAPSARDGDYILRIPRIKQGSLLPRTEFKERRLSSQLGEPLATFRNSVIEKYKDILADPEKAPLFPPSKGNALLSKTGLESHATAVAVTKRVIATFKRLSVPSERLGGNVMHVTPQRLRRTFATRAAEEGWSLLVLAEILDHASTKHVAVYAGLTAKVRANFSRKVAMDMAPLATAFSGKIIKNEDEATYPGQKSRIIDLRIDQFGTPMGNCGSNSSCGFLRPIACYAGCPSFEPWLDGPHEAVFDFLWSRREELMRSTDIRIASINDRAILGCAQIIYRCRQLETTEKS